MSGDDLKEEAVPAAVKHLQAVPAPPGELENLFRAHSDQIFRTAYRITGSAGDAEDVLQTIFLRLARREGTEEINVNPKSYLLRAAVNASLDLLRSHNRSKAVALEDVEKNLFEKSERSPAAMQEDSELRALVREAVSNLGSTAAEMFALRYFEGHDNREIARMMNTSQMVVAVTLHRSRTRLRKEIGHYLEKHHEA